MITIKTNHGDISVELYDEKAPISAENFRQYITDGHYNDTIFHRVIPNFMVQGGGMDKDMGSKATRDPIKNEAENGELNLRGTLAMARTGVVDSATSQLFINLRNNSEVLWSNPNLRFVEEFDVPQGNTTADPAAFFRQDANAMDRLAQNFARSVVTSILEAF